MSWKNCRETQGCRNEPQPCGHQATPDHRHKPSLPLAGCFQGKGGESRSQGCHKEAQSTGCSHELFLFRAAPCKAALDSPSLSTMSRKCLVHLFTKSIFAQLTHAWLSPHHLICLAHMEQGDQGCQCPKITPPSAASPDTSSLWKDFPTEQGCCNHVVS